MAMRFKLWILTNQPISCTKFAMTGHRSLTLMFPSQTNGTVRVATLKSSHGLGTALQLPVTALNVCASILMASKHMTVIGSYLAIPVTMNKQTVCVIM